MSTHGETWTDLCGLDEIQPGRGQYIEHGDHDLAVLRIDEHRISVMDNRCPHAGGSLASGFIDEGCIVCPWHGWSFELETGKCPSAPQIDVRVYPARVHDGRVEAQIRKTA